MNTPTPPIDKDALIASLLERIEVLVAQNAALAARALALMRSMSGRWSDEHIATSLNRMGLPTGQGKTWTADRVASVRCD